VSIQRVGKEGEMFGPAHRTIFSLALAASLIFGVASAQAANLVPNPGFEDVCPGPLCHWSPTYQLPWITIATDTTTKVSGSASLAVTTSFSTGDASSDCFPVSPLTTYNVGTWYRTTQPEITVVGVAVLDFMDAGCTSPTLVSQGPQSLAPVTNGTWTLLSGLAGTGAFAQSAFISVYFTCAPKGCPAGSSANYDDVFMQTEPLAVTVVSLSAKKVTAGVLLHWRTGTEAGLLGFQVYRSRGNSWRRISHSLIAAKGSVSGASYRFLDRTARRAAAYRYRIKAVNRDGTTNWFGPVPSA
jgi:hypothetical protein